MGQGRPCPITVRCRAGAADGSPWANHTHHSSQVRGGRGSKMWGTVVRVCAVAECGAPGGGLQEATGGALCAEGCLPPLLFHPFGFAACPRPSGLQLQSPSSSWILTGAAGDSLLLRHGWRA